MSLYIDVNADQVTLLNVWDDSVPAEYTIVARFYRVRRRELSITGEGRIKATPRHVYEFFREFEQIMQEHLRRTV